jgi:hypothetical protein
MRNWSLEVGLYPGILLGIRTYENIDNSEHVLYFPLVEFILTIYKEENEHTDES